jgi:indolepyruvate ferredoxin oxidoreductase
MVRSVCATSYPDEIRGYGPVKDEAAERAEAHFEALRAQFSKVLPDGTNVA